jgi:non-specific serine/threonine protein kinase/serine/threonine-protein kinase
VREVDPEPPSTAITKVETYTNESGQRCTRTPEDVAKQRGEPADRLRRDLRGDVDQIVLMAMSKSPKRRYASAMDFAADLQRHLDGFPVIARPVSAAHKAAKFVRRNRGAVAGASAVAVALLLGVAGVAWQAGEARRERAFAIAQGERLARVRAFAGEFLESLQARIDRTEGSLPAREELARASIAILDYLSQEFPDDPELRFITAQAWRRIGDVQGGSTGNLGQTRQALASYSRAIELLEGQVRSSNDEQGSLDLLLARAGTAYAIADLQQRAGLGDRGRAHIDDVLRILDNVPPNLAASTRAKRQRAVALLLRAADHEASGNTARAEADLAASIAIRREILSNSPNDAGALRDLSVALNRLGERFAANNDGPSALRSYREALQLRAALASQPGADQTAKRDAAMSRRYVGYTLVTLGQTAEGLAPSKTSLP